MRTSRGLQITSLVVLSPVILILLSLVTIMVTTVISQLQLCLPTLTLPTQSFSRWATSALTLSTVNATSPPLFDTLLPNHTHQTQPELSPRSNGFKRWRPLKKSPWLYGLSFFLGCALIHKLDRWQPILSRLKHLFAFTQKTGHGLSCGKKWVAKLQPPLSDTMDLENLWAELSDEPRKPLAKPTKHARRKRHHHARQPPRPFKEKPSKSAHHACPMLASYPSPDLIDPPQPHVDLDAKATGEQQTLSMSPCLSSLSMESAQEEVEPSAVDVMPVAWYSPFSTGLNIPGILPHHDPLEDMDLMQWSRKVHTVPLQLITPPSSPPLAPASIPPQSNITLLQNHPFIPNRQRSFSSSTSSSTTFGPIGSPSLVQKQPASTSYSLFV
ncbi:hypothetical protein DM01DRAFT_1331708 [Hesseltinella vesiculosa]|uniref:Uncharacterized protein n=1 Tax=Hesseltinella vesiculosa TaxID=101127 RepID=A0A1X2GW81_9FUNG|nr:hypothetical protein DM01DRAFT_1331708 [Hesseltinella vesiculosa]